MVSHLSRKDNYTKAPFRVPMPNTVVTIAVDAGKPPMEVSATTKYVKTAMKSIIPKSSSGRSPIKRETKIAKPALLMTVICVENVSV
jgi:hypothetical protein